MSSKAIVDAIVTNFNDNRKSVNAILGNNVIYERNVSAGKRTTFRISNPEYIKLQQYHTYLLNSIKELNKMIQSERINLKNNEDALKRNESAIYSGDNMLANNVTSLEKKKSLLNSREYQYELAIKRNEHRRQMVIMLALLNTLGLIIYYFTSK
jgi:hypothetical protein